jgi:glycosyltransferase involved in cell wall biosynthesis
MKQLTNMIDVIIPTYNSMPWVIEAIQSVLLQTHSNLNVYVIDDGSSDNTEAEIGKIKDPRLNYIRMDKNRGASAARNYGFQLAKSDYIALLDSDDSWHPTKLEKQMKIITSDSTCGLVYCGIYVKDENGIITRNLIPQTHITLDELYKGNLVVGSASAVLIRKSILDQVGGFNENLINGEDWELWLRIARVSKLNFTTDILADITVRSMGVQSNSKRMADELINTFQYIVDNHKLSREQKIYLGSYCLYNTSLTYENLQFYDLSRQTMLKLLRLNPHAALMPSAWRIRFTTSPIARVLLSTRFSRFSLKVSDKMWRKLDWMVDKVYRRIRG